MRRNPANRNSSTVGGSGALAEYIDAGSAPIAMHTGIRSPRSAISRQCAAPTLWRCQCIASVFFESTCTRYIPTFRTFVCGSLLMTIGSVMYGPPSSGQQVMIGSFPRSISSPRQTTSWHAGVPPFTRGGNFAISSSRGSSANLPSSPSGTLRSSSCVMRAPCSSRSATPSESAIRFIEPKRLIATGYGEREPSASTGCSNKQRLAAARLLHHAVGDLAELELDAHGLANARELADRVDGRDELGQ